MDYKAIDKWLEEHAPDRDTESEQLWIDRSLLELQQDQMDNLLSGRDADVKVDPEIRAQDREDTTRAILTAAMRSRNTRILQENKRSLRRVAEVATNGQEPLDWRLCLDPDARVLVTERSEQSGRPLRARWRTITRGDLTDMLLWDVAEGDREQQIRLDNRVAIRALTALFERSEGATTLDDIPSED
jgi:hypothetical protein